MKYLLTHHLQRPHNSLKIMTQVPPRKWFELLDRNGEVVGGGPTFISTHISNVQELRHAAKAEFANALKDVDAAALAVYDCEATYIDRGSFLAPDASVSLFGESKEIPIVVSMRSKKRKVGDGSIIPQQTFAVEPKPTFASWFFSQMEELEVAREEYQLDNLINLKHSSMSTTDLHEFWQGYGGFPKQYFVRLEEIKIWEVIKSLLPDIGLNRIVLLGSPGVGKSCFLMLVSFYVACVMKRPVMAIRYLKQGDVWNSLVYFDGNGSVAQASNVVLEQLTEIRKWIAMTPSNERPMVLIDGLTQKEMANHWDLQQFHILATSCQYSAKHDDHVVQVAMPAWHLEDFLTYAKSTDWIVSSGNRKTECTKENDSTLRELVEKQFYYTGGSLREFCLAQIKIKDRVISVCGEVDRKRVLSLINTYIGDRSHQQMDHLRRHYVMDREQLLDYTTKSRWQVVVDSGYAMKTLGADVAMKFQMQLFNYAKGVGGGFYGIAYENLLHQAVVDSTQDAPVVIRMREGSKFDKIKIHTNRVECHGETEDDCLSYLAVYRTDTYWRPDYLTFPLVDAVVVCDGYRSGSDDPERLLVFVQVTIQAEKTFNSTRWSKLKESVGKNTNITNHKPPLQRVFLVVGPDASVSQRFNLHDAPTETEVDVMVGYFDPAGAFEAT